ncbi:hypothetical protein [Chelativorans multitrophicus]|jgi:hypothetical protein|uniref:hypothetical protein n=1 Tax=Chelativorans multitrophicus TaxID=449973 RepID=UPI00030CBD92|nr:hypothetical protein [Chelativorans multitrophicus]
MIPVLHPAELTRRSARLGHRSAAPGADVEAGRITLHQRGQAAAAGLAIVGQADRAAQTIASSLLKGIPT